MVTPVPAILVHAPKSPGVDVQTPSTVEECVPLKAAYNRPVLVTTISVTCAELPTGPDRTAVQLVPPFCERSIVPRQAIYTSPFTGFTASFVIKSSALSKVSNAPGLEEAKRV